MTLYSKGKHVAHSFVLIIKLFTKKSNNKLDYNMNILQLYYIRAISHALWFREGREVVEEFQGGSSVRWGKGWYGGLGSLWGSNSLQHRALPGHLDQSGYSKSQTHRAEGRQSPKDSRSLKNSHKKVSLK